MSDIEALKKKSIVEYLESLGIKPKSTHGRTYKYLSPWRGESSPSLHVYPTNTWNDFGEGCGGSIIELVEKLHGVDFVGALRILEGNSSVKNVSVMPKKDEPPPIRIISIGEITSEFLVSYLKKRCISLEVARRYCKQLRVELRKDDNTTYRKTMIGFVNTKGGYEMRNKFSKISNSPKYYSSINPGHPKCLVFEGFMDVLSFVEIYGEPTKYTIICLNSASFVDYVDWSRFEQVVYCGDADQAGDKTFDKIQAITPTKDIRHIFSPFKDLNEWLIRHTEIRNEFMNKKLL